jgi:hypothetical protein
MFDPNNFSLLQPVQDSNNNLVFKSSKTGAVYPATPDKTLLAQGIESGIGIYEKYKYAISSIAYDDINPIRKTSGCPTCGRIHLRFRCFGPNEEIIYACICGWRGNFK